MQVRPWHIPLVFKKNQYANNEAKRCFIGSPPGSVFGYIQSSCGTKRVVFPFDYIQGCSLLGEEDSQI